MRKGNKKSSSEYWLRNKEACAERRRKWREANPDYDKKRREANKERYKLYWLNDAHRRRANLGTPSELTIEYMDVLRRDPCCYCGKPTRHIDHIEPVSLGGLHTWENLTGACSKCNLSKRTDSLLLFLRG